MNWFKKLFNYKKDIVAIVPMIDSKKRLVCMPYSVSNLHTVAKTLGMKRGLFRSSHYAVPASKLVEIQQKSVIITATQANMIIKGEIKTTVDNV